MAQHTLVAYQTKGGVTGENARIIADTLRDEFQHQVDLVDLKTEKVPDLAPYQNVVVGAGVRVARPYGRAKRFARDKKLADKRVAIFFSSAMAGDDPEGATAKWEKKFCGNVEHLKPVACQAFGGRMPFGDRTDFTDPEKVREWAHRLGELFKAPG